MKKNGNELTKILIIAGDTSGDLHAAKVMKRLLDIRPDLKFVGIGGEKMTELGLEKIIDLSKISVVGFWEVLKNIDIFLELKGKIKKIIENDNIPLFIPVDYPGFNLEIAKICTDNNVKALWYIAPQLWAWGQKRAEKLKQYVDKLLVVFPFEEKFFNSFDINNEFVGHPLMDNSIFSEPLKPFNERQNNLLILPGSRKQEIELHIQPLLKYCEIFESNYSNFDIVFSIPPHLHKFVTGNYPQIKRYNIEIDSHILMQNSKIGLIKSGTSNLEAALLGLPFIMFYRTSWFNYLIGKRLTKVPYFSIVNILSNKLVVDELIQNQMNPRNIQLSIDKIISNEVEYLQKQKIFYEIKATFLGKSASERVAKIALSYLGE